MADKIRKRSEIPEKYKWRLSDIFVDVAAWEAAYAEAEKTIAAFSAFDGKVADDPKAAIRAYFETYKQLIPIYSYASMLKDSDNGDTAAQALEQKAVALLVKCQTASAFLEPELLTMEESKLVALSQEEDMEDYSTFLKELLLQKPHTLSKDQERLLAMMGEIAGTPDNIYTMLSNVDLKFPDITLTDGSKAPLTEGTYSSFIHDDQRDVRRQAFEGLMGTYGKFGNTITGTYSASVKMDQFMADARHYSSARAAAMEPLQIPESVYDNLIQVIHEYLPVLNEYLELRKQVLDVDELHMYDLYCPMVKDFKMDMPYEKAFDLVLEGLAPMGEDYLAKLREARDNGWIDVYPNENKTSGAYSNGFRGGAHPFVLLNHNDNLDSAFTIAHELGHSMHSYFSNLTQPFPKADYSLFVAEVASTCNEAVMMRYLLEKLPEKKAQAYLLNHFLEQFRTTCFRQTMFAEFEKISHEMAAKGEPLTRESLSNAYYKLNETYYGSACVVDEVIANEWMRIPHFYRAFYVYVYATGLCAAVSLSEKILAEGESAVKDYRKFLSAGSSVPPIEALKLAGIDMSSPEPIRKAMEVFRATLEKFKAVL